MHIKTEITIPLPRPQMTVMASRITRQSSVCSTVCSDWQQRSIKCPLYCPCVRRINRWLVDSPHKGTVSRNIFPFDELIMQCVFIPSASTKLKEGYTGFTLLAYLSVRMSVCGQNRVRSVSSTILIGPISYLHIAWSNFRRCVACNVCLQIQKFKILAHSLNW